MFRHLLAAKGIHYLATRFGPPRLRSIAFDAKYERGDWCFEGRDVVLGREVLRYLGNGDLLIMGCGRAPVLEALDRTRVNSVLGVDLSPEAVRRAARYASDRISFQVGDMMTFQCPRSYDVILFPESIYYVPTARQESLLSRLSKSLKPDGVFIVTIVQARRYENILERIRRGFTVLHEYTSPDWSRVLMVFRERATP